MTHTSRSEEAGIGCPVVRYDNHEHGAAHGHFTYLDELRAQTPVAYSDYESGYWLLLTRDLVKEAMTDPELFSSESVICTVPEPDWMWIPTMVNPPEHTGYRRLLNRAFAPRAVAMIRDRSRRDCREIIDRLVGSGRCEFVSEFARVFPTTVFLRILGLPQADTDIFVGWVEAIFSGFDEAADPDAAEARRRAQDESHAYFSAVLADRKAEPRGEEDFFTTLSIAEVDGRPITDDEFVNMANVLLLAGLDTVTSQLGYMIEHLASHPLDRRRLLDEPDIVPHAVEELLRAYSIVMPARKVTRDVEFHGCPMKEGDMVLMTLPSASRDEAEFDHPTEVDFDRDSVRHSAFAFGPHRCAGSHLARMELTVAIEEWHRAIPDYRIAETKLDEKGGQLGITRMHVEWDPR